MKIVSSNKNAHFNYFILETYLAGIVLEGCEVKSIRQNGMTINESFIIFKNNEVFLKNSFIKPYQSSQGFAPKPDRDRKLLLNKNEILKLSQKVSTKGLTLVPTKVGLSGSYVKVEIGLGRGKKLYDKKDTLKEKDIKREITRQIKSY